MVGGRGAALNLRPIGRLRTPFRTLADCPRNGRALQPAPDCTAEIDPAFETALDGIDGFSHLIVLYWLGPQPDRLTVTPAFDRRERGVLATRSPVRPNPIGLSVAAFEGRASPLVLRLRYLDCRDGTPLLDLKPYLARTDSHADATMGWLAER